MQNSVSRTLALVAFGLFVAGGAAQAQGKGHGHGHGHEQKPAAVRGHDHDRNPPPSVRDHGRDENGSQMHRRDPDEDQGRGYGNGGMPPGLARKGGMPPGLRKTGGVPPGQLKKYYRPDDGVSVLSDVFGRHGYSVLRTVPSGDARYVYYRYHDGTVHRAIVRPYNDQLSFSNVPRSLLSEVLARLR